MQITWGKVVWAITIIIFLFMAYNMSTFQRLWDIATSQEDDVKVSEYNPFEKQDSVLLDTTSVVDLPENATFSGEGNGGLSWTASPTPEGVVTDVDLNLHLKVERMIWEIDQLNEKITNLKVEVAELTAEKNTTTGNLAAVIGALTPLLLPVITSKFGNHKKVIMGKKS